MESQTKALHIELDLLAPADLDLHANATSIYKTKLVIRTEYFHQTYN